MKFKNNAQRKAVMARLKAAGLNTGVSKVRIAYADSHRNMDEDLRDLNYRGAFNKNKKTASEQINQIGDYNDFNPSKTNRVISGPEVKSVRVARENSPAIYVETANPNLTTQKFKNAKADEITVERKKGNNSIIRAWWD